MDKSERKKIGIIAWERFGYGGISRVVSSLISSLTEDFEVSVLCLKDERFFQNLYNIDTTKVKFTFTEMTFLQKIRREFANRVLSKITSSSYLIKKYPYFKYSTSYLRSIVTWVNDNAFDIILFSTGFDDCLQLAAIKKFLTNRPKLIAWSHTEFSYYFKNPKTRSFTQNLWKYHYKNFDAIIVLSDKDVIDFKRYLNLNAVRIYNPNSFTPTKRTNLCNKKFLYLGSLSKTKGTDILINAFIEFANTNEEWSLDFYGEGAITEWVQRKVAENNLQERVKIFPYTLDVEDVYANHDIFILPSRYEGFGIVQIEAAGCGLPLIASDVAISRELIGKYHHGVLFKRFESHDLAKQMQIMTNSNLTTYSNCAVEAAKDFTIERISSEWKRLLHQL